MTSKSLLMEIILHSMVLLNTTTHLANMPTTADTKIIPAGPTQMRVLVTVPVALSIPRSTPVMALAPMAQPTVWTT